MSRDALVGRMAKAMFYADGYSDWWADNEARRQHYKLLATAAWDSLGIEDGLDEAGIRSLFDS